MLFLLENIGYPLDFVTVNDIVMQTDYVAYLDFAEAFNEMLDSGLIEQAPGEDTAVKYVVTEKGKCIARELSGDILPTILDQSLAKALRYLDFKKRGITPKCEVNKREDGRFDITFTLTENKNCIFMQTLVVDTFNRASRMKTNFYENPENVYKGVLALMSGNVNYLFS